MKQADHPLWQRLDFFDQIKGFMARDEAENLYELGRDQARLGPCLEIGGYCGLSTVCIGLGVRERGGVLFSVDHHQGSEEHQPDEEYHDASLFDSRTGRMNSFPVFLQTITRAGLQETVVPIVAPSGLAARQWATPLSLVFIDGGHSFEAALRDYRGWAPQVMIGGMLAVHDIFTDPSQGGQAPHEIAKMAQASGLFEPAGMVNTLGLFRRLG